MHLILGKEQVSEINDGKEKQGREGTLKDF